MFGEAQDPRPWNRFQVFMNLCGGFSAISGISIFSLPPAGEDPQRALPIPGSSSVRYPNNSFVLARVLDREGITVLALLSKKYAETTPWHKFTR
jgi:hypothetical protein